MDGAGSGATSTDATATQLGTHEKCSRAAARLSTGATIIAVVSLDRMRTAEQTIIF